MSANPTYSPYGAYELKASYQKNLLIGNLSVVTLVSLILLVTYILSLGTDTTILNIPPSQPKSGEEDRGSVPLDSDRIRIVGEQPVVIDNPYAIPIPVADEDFIENENITLISIDNYTYGDGTGEISDAPIGGDGAVGGTGRRYDEIIYPGEEEYVPVDKIPEMYQEVKPEYPRLCRQAGLEGELYIKALVDIDGSVKKAIIAKSSNVEAFDNSALEAALLNKFTPAIHNSQPVACWVSYKVVFQLH